MAVKKIQNLNKHENPSTNTDSFDVENYLNANWERILNVVDNNANELIALQTDNKISKQDIADIQQEQAEQNANIEELQQENIELKAKEKELELECERLREDINALPSISDSGENITLKGTAEARFNKFGISGNSWQKTSTIGKNKLDITKPFLTGKIYDANGAEYDEPRANTYSLKVKEGITYFISIAIGGSFFTTWKDGVMTSRVIKTAGVVTITKNDSFDEIRYSLFTDVENFAESYINENENTGYEAFVPNMPSMDYKSDTQNISGNANVTICNKNLRGNLQNGYWDSVTKTLSNKDSLIFKSFKVFIKAGTYVLSCNTKMNIIRAFVEDNNGEYIIFSDTAININSYIITIEKDTTLYVTVRRNDNTNWLNTDLLQLEKGEIATDYIEHKEQNFTFPLVEGQKLHKTDYLANDGIHHRRTKIELDGTENLQINTNYTTDNLLVVQLYLADSKSATTNLMSNRFKYNSTSTIKNTIRFATKYLLITLDKQEFSTLEEFKTKVVELHNNKNSIVFEYELAEEEIEEYNEEQQAIYNQINKTAKSYNGTTHLFSTDEISPIFDVEARKDMQLENNILQAQIDEIKTLLSTTATSAMLLDSMQTDLESEV